MTDTNINKDFKIIKYVLIILLIQISVTGICYLYFKHFVIGSLYIFICLPIIGFILRISKLNYKFLDKPTLDSDRINEANTNARLLTQTFTGLGYMFSILLSFDLIFTYDFKWYISIPIAVLTGFIYPLFLSLIVKLIFKIFTK